MHQPQRNIGPTLSSGYSYGFNGMEKDDDVKGSGNSYTTEFRQYDPRVGRWLSLDPLEKKYPGISPYTAMGNNPIFFVDPNGDSLNVSNLYQKDSQGNLVNYEEVLAFEAFASTPEGEAYIRSVAEQGFELKGEILTGLNIKADQEGDLSKQGIDVEYKTAPITSGMGAWTSPFIKGNDRLLIQINLCPVHSTYYGIANPNIEEDVLRMTHTIIHETFVHGYLQTERYLQGERNRAKILGPDHSKDYALGTPFFTYGLKMMTEVKKIPTIANLTTSTFSSLEIYNWGLNGLGYSSETQLPEQFKSYENQ